MPERRVVIRTDAITLDALLKWAGVVGTGGEAKRQIQAGRLRVNGAVERRRGRRVRPGDRVQLADGTILVIERAQS